MQQHELVVGGPIIWEWHIEKTFKRSLRRKARKGHGVALDHRSPFAIGLLDYGPPPQKTFSVYQKLTPKDKKIHRFAQRGWCLGFEKCPRVRLPRGSSS